MATRIITPRKKPTDSEKEKSLPSEQKESPIVEINLDMSFDDESPQENPKTKKAKEKRIEDVVAGKQEDKEKAETETEEKIDKEEQRKRNIALWGNGFTESDFETLNTKLEEFTRYYPLKTAMHKEALVRYLKYAQMCDKSISAGDVDAADKWGKLAAKQAQDAKINPSQLSVADLSNGVSNFSKISETVEKVTDIVSRLPKYIRHPRDEVDYTIWQIVNYLRRLSNMPEVSYEEVYKFLLDKYNENKNQYEFLIKENDKKYKEPI